jgi:tRNA A-37 threonylcarbamoyl transferase component Bud32
MPEWIGRTLGKVHVDLLLARGGMAEVYLGKHTTLQRAVAVKVLNNQYADDPDLLDRFQREARAVAMLRHPNIVQVYDFDAIEGHPYLIMEYVAGLSLSTYMRGLPAGTQGLDLLLVNRLIGPLAGALQYAHEHGVIHRDIKPGNILLTSTSVPVEAGKPLPADVQPVLTDFGLVRFLHSPRQTSTGQIAGTPAYMSPEQARGDAVDGRSDIYSLGIVLYELLAGHIPFEADTTMGLLLKQINEPPPPIPGLAPDLQQVIERALAKQASERYQTPGELAAALQAAVEARVAAPTVVEGRSGPPASSAKMPAPKKPDKSWLIFPALTAVALLIAGFFAIRSFVARPPALPTAGGYEGAGTPASAQTPMVVGSAQPLGVLRFQDGAASVDEVTMSASNMPLPPEGEQYQVWLVEESGEELRSLGYLSLDPGGNGTVTFVDPQGRNLLAAYDKMEITVEPSPDASPNPSNQVAFSSGLPPGGLLHVRHLLVAFPATPGNTALADGLLKDARLVDDSAQRMLAAYQAGDQAATRLEAESILNLLVGGQSDDHKDWDGDGQVADPGDGYGLLLNGDNSGYIQATYSHADFAVTAEDATANMKVHGEHVKICAQNLEQWTPQLRDLMKQILAAPAGSDAGQFVRPAVALADNMLKGTDLNGDEKIEPIPGEGGAQTAYQHAFYMADMTIVMK